jgi:hypothetical protein
MYIFDLVIHQDAQATALILPKYHYGGLGFRGNRRWKTSEQLLSSPPKAGSPNGRTKAAGAAFPARPAAR